MCAVTVSDGDADVASKDMRTYMAYTKAERGEKAIRFLELLKNKKHSKTQVVVVVVAVSNGMLKQHLTCLLKVVDANGLLTTAGLNFAPSQYWQHSLAAQLRKRAFKTPQNIQEKPQFGFCCPDRTIGNDTIFKDSSRLKILAMFTLALGDAKFEKLEKLVTSTECNTFQNWSPKDDDSDASLRRPWQLSNLGAGLSFALLDGMHFAATHFATGTRLFVAHKKQGLHDIASKSERNGRNDARGEDEQQSKAG